FAGREAETDEIDLQLIRAGCEIGQAQLRLAERRDVLRRTRHAETREQHGRRQRLSFWFRQEARQALRRADPEPAVARAEGGRDLAARKAVGCRVVLDAARRRV